MPLTIEPSFEKAIKRGTLKLLKVPLAPLFFENMNW